MKIVLHIERLVLDGVVTETARPQALQDAVQTELVRLLGDGAALARAWPQSTALRRIVAAPLTVPPAPSRPGALPADELGRRIATSIHAGLGEVPR
ncbi:hypothetical protein [Paraburkholderia sp. BCC1886]|uniref:hypothetical protein n=1 Tax=Paraburkholderia sp. BCC1886 TaxID=2562670 RepID=UPI001182C6F5|nr:hypothetical protein [Paraburkholderia sp. BCC1886]